MYKVDPSSKQSRTALNATGQFQYELIVYLDEENNVKETFPLHKGKNVIGSSSKDSSIVINKGDIEKKHLSIDIEFDDTLQNYIPQILAFTTPSGTQRQMRDGNQVNFLPGKWNTIDLSKECVFFIARKYKCIIRKFDQLDRSFEARGTTSNSKTSGGVPSTRVDFLKSINSLNSSAKKPTHLSPTAVSEGSIPNGQAIDTLEKATTLPQEDAAAAASSLMSKPKTFGKGFKPKGSPVDPAKTLHTNFRSPKAIGSNTIPEKEPTALPTTINVIPPKGVEMETEDISEKQTKTAAALKNKNTGKQENKALLKVEDKSKNNENSNDNKKGKRQRKRGAANKQINDLSFDSTISDDVENCKDRLIGVDLGSDSKHEDLQKKMIEERFEQIRVSSSTDDEGSKENNDDEDSMQQESTSATKNIVKKLDFEEPTELHANKQQNNTKKTSSEKASTKAELNSKKRKADTELSTIIEPEEKEQQTTTIAAKLPAKKFKAAEKNQPENSKVMEPERESISSKGTVQIKKDDKKMESEEEGEGKPAESAKNAAAAKQTGVKSRGFKIPTSKDSSKNSTTLDTVKEVIPKSKSSLSKPSEAGTTATTTTTTAASKKSISTSKDSVIPSKKADKKADKKNEIITEEKPEKQPDTIPAKATKAQIQKNQKETLRNENKTLKDEKKSIKESKKKSVGEKRTAISKKSIDNDEDSYTPFGSSSDEEDNEFGVVVNSRSRDNNGRKQQTHPSITARKFNVLFSNCLLDETDVSDKLTKLGARVLKTIQQSFNILIMDTFSRRAKTLVALNKGAKIVSSAWALDCICENRLIPELEKYEIQTADPAFSKKHKFDMKAMRARQEAQSTPIFDGLHFILPESHEYANISREDLEHLISTAGGVIAVEGDAKSIISEKGISSLKAVFDNNDAEPATKQQALLDSKSKHDSAKKNASEKKKALELKQRWVEELTNLGIQCISIEAIFSSCLHQKQCDWKQFEL